MDNAAAAYYIVTFFSVVAVLVVTGVLIWLSSRMRKEQTFVGFRISRDEMYAGYSLLAVGIAVIVVAVIEIMLLLTGQVAAPFGLTYISLAGITFPGELLSISYGVSFWLLILWAAGGKIASLGLDLLRGTTVKLHIKIR
jgi:hypothetical protein